MRLAHSTNFGPDFIDDQRGVGQLSVTDGIFKATGIAGGDRAIKTFFIPNTGYSIIKVSVLARAAFGAAFLAVDGNLGNNATDDYRENIDITSTDSSGWVKLELRVIVDPKYGSIRVTLGRPGSYNLPSEAYFKDLSIEYEGINSGSSIVLAQGLIGLQNGVLTLRPSYRNFGVSDMLYNPTTRELTVYLNQNYPQIGNLGFFPIVHVTGTPESTIGVVAGSFAAGIPSRFIVKFIENGQFIDISNRSLFFSFTVAL